MRMKITPALLLGLTSLLFTNTISGQDAVNHEALYPNGINIDYGLGHFSLRDEFISKEKYSGTLPYFSVYWSRFHNKYGFRQKFEIRSSSKIRNYNIATDIIQFSLHRDYLYPAGTFTLFSKNVFTYIGPSTEFFLFSNTPKYVEGGVNINYSFILLISGGINFEFIVPFQHRIQIESSIYLSLLSLGIRTPKIVVPKENTEEEESVAKLLTPFSGMNSIIDVGTRYYFNESFSLKVTYKFQSTRIRSWDPLFSVSDNVIFTLSYHF